MSVKRLGARAENAKRAAYMTVQGEIGRDGLCPPDSGEDDTAEEPTVTSQLSVANATASEEDDSTIDFVVTLNPAGEASITVDYATANGTASAGSDYTAQSGRLTFGAGETSKTVTVAIIDDSTEESDETLTLTLSNPSGAEISAGQATGTITDSEPAPLTVSFSNVPDSHRRQRQRRVHL